MTENWQRAFVATFPEVHPMKNTTPASSNMPAPTRASPDKPRNRHQRARADHSISKRSAALFLPQSGQSTANYGEGVVVSLDGHGADEMLGGYTHHAQTHFVPQAESGSNPDKP
jgi:hypothetical protein